MKTAFPFLNFLSRFALVVLCSVALAACSGGRSYKESLDRDDAEDVPTAVKVGKPYVVMGQTYTPRIQMDYDEIGLASWYGPGFHGKRTANGERFDSKALTGAHPTLPLPSLVRVTDLLTGKSVIVRINDRGPFSEKRIIDLSSAAAGELGIKARGIAKVRVQFLPEETDRYLASISSPERPLAYPTEAPAVILADNTSQDMPYADLQESRNVAAIAPVGAVEQYDLPATGKQLRPAPMRTLSPPQEETPVALEGDERVVPFEETNYSSVPAPISAPEPRTITAIPFERSGTYVQAGSFSIAGNADHLAERLRSIGPAFVTRQTVRDQTWYRVRLGPIAEREEASALLRRVNSLGFPDAKIIQD